LNFAAKFIEKIDSKNERITFQNISNDSKTEKRANLKVKLGIMPSFEDTKNQGLKIDGVSPNSIAEKSGMQKGDLIVEINNQKVNNLTDYTLRMSNINPGDKSIF
jgi:S1-C subfamily serine protease